MASHGSSNESLVAMQNIVVRLDTNADIALGQEPEVDIEDDKVSRGHCEGGLLTCLKDFIIPFFEILKIPSMR